MNYKKIFNPDLLQISGGYENPSLGYGDYDQTPNYLYSQDIILAVNIALATGRPLLVRGASGSGKSALARSVASVLERPLYETVITSQSQAKQLLWDVDMLYRLQDAQAMQLKDDISHYIQPGIFWHAFDAQSALKQQQKASRHNAVLSTSEPKGKQQAVILIDEIDKADPDLPNNLLVPIGSLQFTVEETGEKISAQKPPLVFITTNDERELPPAFLRRCVEVTIAPFSAEQLVQVGQAHFDKFIPKKLLKAVADLVVSTRDQSSANASTSPAEYLDTVRSCFTLGIEPESKEWDLARVMTLNNHGF